MTLNQLTVFLTICSAGSLTAAAEILHISQPSLSVSLKNLEEEFGIRLFYRERKRLVLTDAGAVLREEGTQIVEQLADLEEKMKKYGHEQCKLRIGVNAMPSIFISSKFIFPFCNQNPDAYIEIYEVSTLDAISRVQEDKLDFAIVIDSNNQMDRLQMLKLWRTKVVGCVRKDHPLANQRDVLLEDLENENLVTGPDKSKVTGLMRGHLDANGVKTTNTRLYSKQAIHVMQFVKVQNAVAFFLEEIMGMALDEEVAPFYLKEPTYYDITLIYRKDLPITGLSKKFIVSCKSIAKTIDLQQNNIG